MGFEESGELYGPGLDSTPKLTLTKPATWKPAWEPELTPPIHQPASIPFQWEEAPGRPRTTGSSTAATCRRILELPPRLTLAELTISPSPAAVPSLSLSFGKGEGRGSFDFSHPPAVNMTRRRLRSFFSLPDMNTNLHGMWSSFRRAVVPWRRRWKR